MTTGRIQEDLVKKQLRREPKCHFEVVKLCLNGFPQVIKNYPLIKDRRHIRIFPTLYWLTCPYLVKEISRLESEGYIEVFEKAIDRDQKLKESYRYQHLSYIGLRWRYLTPKDRRLTRGTGLTENLTQRGIGGLKDFSHLKCLHMHYAHYLVQNNIVGDLIRKLANFSNSCHGPICKKILQ